METEMYIVTAKKDGKKLKIEKMEVDEKGKIWAIWHRINGHIEWQFVKDLGEFKIEVRESL